MTTEHNRRSSDLHIVEISRRGFIIERQEKEIDQLKKLINDVFVPMVTDLCFDLESEIKYRYGSDVNEIHPALKRKYESDYEIVDRARMIIAALPPTTPQEG